MAPSLKKLFLFHEQSKFIGFNMVDEISIQKVATRKKRDGSIFPLEKIPDKRNQGKWRINGDGSKIEPSPF
jgi:hypothetical protein